MWGGGVRGSMAQCRCAAAAAVAVNLQKNEGRRTTEVAGMTVSSSLLAVVLTVVSVASLSLLSMLCLRCKRKSKIKEVQSQIYDPQTFQRGGSKFAVMRSKTVTRANQITSTTGETPEQNEPSGVQTISSSLEPEYVAPIGESVYANEPMGGMPPGINQTPPDYENVFSSLPTAEEDDYENADFLDHVIGQDDSDPDYVNETEYT